MTTARALKYHGRQEQRSTSISVPDPPSRERPRWAEGGNARLVEVLVNISLEANNTRAVPPTLQHKDHQDKVPEATRQRHQPQLSGPVGALSVLRAEAPLLSGLAPQHSSARGQWHQRRRPQLSGPTDALCPADAPQ